MKDKKKASKGSEHKIDQHGNTTKERIGDELTDVIEGQRGFLAGKSCNIFTLNKIKRRTKNINTDLIFVELEKVYDTLINFVKYWTLVEYDIFE